LACTVVRAARAARQAMPLARPSCTRRPGGPRAKTARCLVPPAAPPAQGGAADEAGPIRAGPRLYPTPGGRRACAARKAGAASGRATARNASSSCAQRASSVPVMPTDMRTRPLEMPARRVRPGAQLERPWHRGGRRLGAILSIFTGSEALCCGLRATRVHPPLRQAGCECMRPSLHPGALGQKPASAVQGLLWQRGC